MAASYSLRLVDFIHGGAAFTKFLIYVTFILMLVMEYLLYVLIVMPLLCLGNGLVWLSALLIWTTHLVQEMFRCMFCGEVNQISGMFNGDFCCFPCLDTYGLYTHPRTDTRVVVANPVVWDVMIEEIPCNGKL